MVKAKLSMQGQNQILILPDDFRFNGDEVIITKGDSRLVLIDEVNNVNEIDDDEKWERFLRGVNGFTDDFFENGREQN